MKTRFTILVAVFVMAFSYVQAQEYNSAVGLRFGYPLSVSYKKFLSTQGAMELTAGFRSFSGWSWFNIGGYYQHHNAIESVEGLRWYYGGGANVYFWTFKSGFSGSSTSIGLSGVLGLDYRFKDIPLNLSVDWIPTFFLNGFDNGFAGGYGALSARYILDK